MNGVVVFVFVLGEFNQSINNVDIQTKPYDGKSIARGKFPTECCFPFLSFSL